MIALYYMLCNITHDLAQGMLHLHPSDHMLFDQGTSQLHHHTASLLCPSSSSPGGGSCSSISSVNEKESTPPPTVPPKPEKKPTPAPRKPRVLSPTHAHSEGASEEQEPLSSPHANTSSSSLPVEVKPFPQERQKTPPPLIPPRQKSPPPSTPPQEPDSSKASTSQPAAEIPPEVPARLTKSPPQSPVTEEEVPPPLPEKSSLSRQVQLSVKRSRSTPVQSTHSSTKPLEPENNDLDSMSIVQNTSYIRTSFSDIGAGTTEPLYTEPLLPGTFSPPSKPKPARPPPPSSSAIQRAKERKEKVLANRQLQSTTLRSTARFPARTLHSVSRHTMRGHHSVTASNTSLPSNSTHAHPVMQSSAAPRPADYEDLDSELDRYVVSPTDTSPRVFRVSQTSLTSPVPPLPPRAPSSSKHSERRKKQNHTPIASGFSRQLEDNKTDSSPVSSAEKLEKKEEEEEGDGELDKPESVYEPVDASVPLPPQRMKKNIRGTRTMTMVKRNRGLTTVHVGQRTSKLRKEKGSMTDPLERRTLNSRTKQNSKLALQSTSFSSTPRLKGSLSGSLSSEEDGIARVSSVDIEHDVGGVDEYVDMQPRAAWEEKEGKS